MHPELFAALPLGNFWAMEPIAFASMLRFLAGVHIDAAKVDDAIRARLPIERVGNTAVVHLVGPMLRNAGWLEFYGFASTRKVQRAIEAAAADSSANDIVLRIDSPGGAVDGTQELADAIYLARQQKPVIAQVDGMMASAALFAGVQASTVRAGRDNLVGSIGVRMTLIDASRLFANEGVEVVSIDTGKYKSAGLIGTEITPEQRQDFQRIVDAAMDDFVAAVSRGRGMTEQKVRQLGDGRIFTAPESVENGLVDTIATLDETMAERTRNAQHRRRRARAMALATGKRA